MSLIMHCGGAEVPRAALYNTVMPAPTRTHVPVNHGEYVDLVHDEIRREFGEVELEEAYGLSKDGQRFFGVIGIKLDSDEHGLSIGLRGSHDKTLNRALAAGDHVFVCDNLAFSSSGVKVMRKHTSNVWRDLRSLVSEAIRQSRPQHAAITHRFDKLREIGVTQDRGYEHIGRALGHRVLTPTAGNVAFREWKEPSHEEFADRNAYSLYQAFTESAKVGVPGKSLDRHARVHSFFTTAAGLRIN